jgi:hypothetical protein
MLPQQLAAEAQGQLALNSTGLSADHQRFELPPESRTFRDSFQLRLALDHSCTFHLPGLRDYDFDDRLSFYGSCIACANSRSSTIDCLFANKRLAHDYRFAGKLALERP